MEDNKKEIIVSACSVIYKEEKNIKGMIESIKDFAEEVILVHDGEDVADKTLEIAQDYCKEEKIILKIFKRYHIGNPEHHRPFSFDKSFGKWILWIDADERMTGDKGSLRKFLINCGDVSRIRLLIGTEKDFRSPKFNKRRPSLFKKDSIFYFGAIGQKPGLLNGTSYDYDESVKIIHLDDKRSFFNLLKKGAKYARLNADDMFRPIDKIPKFNLENNADAVEKFDDERNRRRSFSVIYLICSPLLATWKYVKSGQSIKAALAVGIQAFLLYLFIILISLNLIKNNQTS